MRMNVKTVAVIKRPNIQCEAMRAMCRADVMFAGRATAGLLAKGTFSMLEGGAYSLRRIAVH